MKYNNIFRRLRFALKYIFVGASKKDANYLLEVITKVNCDNAYVNHAMKEFKLAGYLDKKPDNEMSILMTRQILELLTVFSMHGHSGFSQGYAIDLFTKLAKFEIISRLTFKADEFHEAWEGSYQNKRDSSVFKNDKGIYDIDAYTKNIIYSKYLNKEDIIKVNGGCYYGAPVFECKGGIATGRGFKHVYFSDKDIKKGCIPYNKIYLPCTQVEVKKDDWLTFVPSGCRQLQELNSIYRIDWFDVLSMKGLPIIKLTSNYGY